jgi:SAM-dependent methyltransferase
MNSPAPLFSAARIAAQRDRLMNAPEGADFLKALTAETIIDRLSMVTREFSQILLIGAHDADLAAHLRTLGTVTIIETGPALARKAGATIMDAESADMPMGSFDLIIWPTGLESVNDVPAALVRMRALLAPDGLLLGAFLGDGSLPKLRRAVMTDGIRTVARMHPQIDLSSMGNLLQRVGFALPVVDVDALDVRYGNIFGLVRDLRANGLSSRLSPAPITPTREEVATMAAAFAAQADPDGRVKEVFRLIHFSGWAPDPSQPKPARRGSATASLADALKNPPEAAKPTKGGAE